MALVTLTLTFLMLSPMVSAAEDCVIVDASGTWTGDGWIGDPDPGTPNTFNIYDGNARVWGNYIVWERSIDLSDNGIVSWGEPSWIMVHDVNNKTSWAITPTIDDGSKTGSLYYHAKSPRIWNKKIVYNEWYGTSSYQTHLVMYNLSYSSSTYWDMPMPTTYSSSSDIEFYGDYIVYGHYGTTVKQCYLYNWVDNDYQGWGRALHETTSHHTYTYSITEDYVTFTTYHSSAPSTIYFMIHNISSGLSLKMSMAGLSVTDFRCNSIYEDLLGIYRTNTIPVANSEAYIIDLEGFNWGAYTNPISSITWASFGDNTTRLTYTDYTDESNIKIWGNYIAWNSNGTSPNVQLYNINRNTTTNITTSPFRQVVEDFKGEKIIFRDNINSGSNHGDKRDDFDIYRTETSLENMGENIIGIIPVILVLLVIGAVIGAMKLFSEYG